MDIRKQLLIRNKTIATGLMIGAAILFVVARSHKGHGTWEWLAAFAEAAMVGALADWFAVVALFRHPLGVPIPHTAIIKNKKDVIAGNLAGFIRDRFLAGDTLIASLREYNPAGHLAVYLMSKEHADGVAKGATRVLADTLDFIDDERVQQICCKPPWATGLKTSTSPLQPGRCLMYSEKTTATRSFSKTCCTAVPHGWQPRKRRTGWPTPSTTCVRKNIRS